MKKEPKQKVSMGLFEYMKQMDKEKPINLNIQDFEDAVRLLKPKFKKKLNDNRMLETVEYIAKHGDDTKLYYVEGWGYIGKTLAQEALNYLIDKAK